MLFSGATAQIFFKLALDKIEDKSVNNIEQFLQFLNNIMSFHFIIALFLSFICLITWLKIISNSTLSKSFNVTAITYIIIALESYFILGELF